MKSFCDELKMIPINMIILILFTELLKFCPHQFTKFQTDNITVLVLFPQALLPCHTVDQILCIEQIVKYINSEFREVCLFNCFILYCVYFSGSHELFRMFQGSLEKMYSCKRFTSQIFFLTELDGNKVLESRSINMKWFFLKLIQE